MKHQQVKNGLAYAGVGGVVGQSRKITQIDYIYQPLLVKAFDNKLAEYDKKYGVGKHHQLLAFHGTKQEHIDSIIKTGFKLNKVGSVTDSGYYGAGIYFSELAATSLAYAKCKKLLLCKVLPGLSLKLTAAQLMNGAPCKAGYDSHGVDACACCESFAELVIFDEAAMLPTYVIHYQ
jgi:hypothetical protein